MSGVGCLTAASLADRRAAGLSEGDRLVLEEHLASCEACAEDAARLAAIVSVLGAPRPMRAAARERAMASALRVARPGPARPKRVVRWWTLPAAASLAVAAVVLIALFATTVLRRDVVASATSDIREPAGATQPRPGRIVDGHARIDDVDVGAGAPWRGGSELSARTPTTISVAHATVRLDADSVVRWDDASSTLTLARGGAAIEVDPAPKLAFRVETVALRVEVLGTGFRVDQDDVRVTHGRVRVVDRASGGAAELGAGESWMALAAPLAPVPELPELPAPPPATSASASATPSAPSSADARQGVARLAEARRLLAADRPAAAEAAVHDALKTPLSAADRAEARTLLAECARARGDEAEAAKRYAEVAKEFDRLPAGETALFAAARAEERAGRHAAAVTLLRQYVAAYPDGRFRREADARLRALDTANSRSPR